MFFPPDANARRARLIELLDDEQDMTGKAEKVSLSAHDRC